MTSQSVVSDYILIILRAIESAQNDPARLRQLIYDVARTSLGKQVLMSYAEIGSEGLQQQISDLEAAIGKVEILARLEAELLPANSDVAMIEGPPSSILARLEAELIPEDSHVPLLEPSASSLSHNAMIVSDQPGDDHNVEHNLHDDEVVLVEPVPTNIYSRQTTAAELLAPTHVWTATVVEPLRRGPSIRLRRLALPIALLIALVISAVISAKSNYLHGLGLPPSSPIAHDAAAAVTPAASNTAPDSLAGTADIHKPDFPLPSVYGVYAESGGKLYALEPLAMRVPDPRVAISAMISSPSQVLIPSGEIAFVVYRRDLAASAPDSASVRIIARVMRELKFSQAGPPKTIDIKGEWAIRSKSFQFGVAPLKNSPEMIVLRPQDPRLVLPAGRYALALKGQGYDFSVAGPVTAPAQCLERTNALGGTVYSECPNTQ